MTQWITFDPCPQCRGMIWSDGDARWCAECGWRVEQRDLFHPTDTDQ